MFWKQLFGPPIESITGQELAKTLKGSAGPYVVDVRTPAEFRQGHIPGAHSIPLGEIKGRLSELPRDRTVVTVCLSGHRSRSAAKVLVGSGFSVKNLEGGMSRWAGPVKR